MNAVLLAIGAGSLAAAVPLVVLVKREYEGSGVLSDFTVAAVWILYTVIIAVVVAAAVAGAWPIGLPAAVSLVIGALLLACGLALEIGGLAAMASFRRMSGLQPDELIVAGAFRFSRNPQNVGIGLAMAGAAVLGDSWMALLFVVGFWLLFYAYVRFEEEHLARAFGDRYERYRRSTPRFLGPPAGRASAG